MIGCLLVFFGGVGAGFFSGFGFGRFFLCVRWNENFLTGGRVVLFADGGVVVNGVDGLSVGVADFFLKENGLCGCFDAFFSGFGVFLVKNFLLKVTLGVG